MCAAHWPAAQALAAACDLASVAGTPGCSKLAISLAICVGKGPPTLAADAELQSMFDAMLAHAPQARWGCAVGTPIFSKQRRQCSDRDPCNCAALGEAGIPCPHCAHHLYTHVRQRP